MPTTDSDLYRESIRRTLAHRAGDVPDADSIAEATLSTWRQMASLLSPVIGVRGVDVLLGRSLHLTSTAYPWLAMTGDQKDSTRLLAGIKTRLVGRETHAAAEASYTLLTTFVDLLTNLIGASLAERLLGPVWMPPLPASKKEIKS